MIYIQSHKERTTLPNDFDTACAMYGAIDQEMKFRLTSFEEVASGKFDAHIKTDLFVGSVEFMREVFKRGGLKPHSIRVPMNSDRKHLTYNLKEVKEIVATGKKLFIKPVEIKLFTGFVLDQCKYPCLNNIPDDTLLMVYDPFETKILTEWRVYIHNHKIVDSRNYSGNYLIPPNYDFVRSRIDLYRDKFPCAYTMDVAVLENYQGDELEIEVDNAVVEFNDMWAIGNYGMPNDLYLKLLTDRYFEIVTSNIYKT